MKFKTLKFSTLFLIIFSILQCQANPKEKELNENGQYKELTELIKNSDKLSNGVSFVAAAAISTPCVVHIKTKMQVTINYYNPFQGFFGQDFFNSPRTQKQESSGSGVIVHSNGFIVTNYHVIQNATEIEVTLRNKNTYKAKVIGTDKDTDLALLKIEEIDLPALPIANSDSVMVGEWVLAVGNPFNLESTVTQGIVSAKGRSLNMSQPNGQSSNPIESFIQTDAAVNPGNSGGALVNLKGELIGINTAIASPTGAYAGYAFAVPSNIVKKVIDDLKEFGNVQRAFLGIKSEPLTSEKAKKLSLPSPNGVLINSIIQGSAAEEAGLKSNDVLIKIDENEISSYPELLEHISTHSPGDKVNITYIRNGAKNTLSATLRNKKNTTEILKIDHNLSNQLGIKTQPLSAQEMNLYRVGNGLKVTKITDGTIANKSAMKEGFIILTINDINVKHEEDINMILQSKAGESVSIEGFYPNRPYTFRYEIKL